MYKVYIIYQKDNVPLYVGATKSNLRHAVGKILVSKSNIDFSNAYRYEYAEVNGLAEAIIYKTYYSSKLETLSYEGFQTLILPDLQFKCQRIKDHNYQFKRNIY